MAKTRAMKIAEITQQLANEKLALQTETEKKILDAVKVCGRAGIPVSFSSLTPAIPGLKPETVKRLVDTGKIVGHGKGVNRVYTLTPKA